MVNDMLMRKNKNRIFLARRLCGCALLCVLIIVLTGCNRTSEQEFSQLSSICELATLNCYYHNVAEYERGANGFLNFNYKKIWIEYGGLVRVGVDASKVSISPPDANGVVLVSLPPVKVLDIDIDEDSIKEVTETGILSRVTSQNEIDLLAEAQHNMEESADKDQSMLMRARERVKTVISEYIKKCGESVGKTYTVQWVETE